MDKARKILIIRNDRLGDLILSTPFIKNVKLNEPMSHIACLVSKGNEEVLQGNKYVDEIISFTNPYSKDSAEKLRNKNFDWIIVLAPLFKSYMLAKKIGSKRRSGFIYHQRILSRLFSPSFLTEVYDINIEDLVARKKNVPHEVEQLLDFGKYLGLKITNDELDFFLSTDEIQDGKKLITYRTGLQHKYYIGIHLSFKWITPDFDIDNLIEFIHFVKNKFSDAHLILTYGPDEAELATEIKKDAVLREHLIGGLSIKEMASLLLELSILITMDTGITHLGACFKIPTVCVYEDRNFDKCKGQWYPWKTRHINIKHSKMIKTENVDWSDIKAMIR